MKHIHDCACENCWDLLEELPSWDDIDSPYDEY